MSFKTKFDYFVSTIAGTLINKVRATAARHHGSCTWEFSQVQNPTKALICAHRDTSSGICEMLSAFWIERHAKDDSLANFIAPTGTIDPNKIRMIMQYFAIGTTMNPGAMAGNAQSHIDASQTAATRRWLLKKNIIPKTGVKPLQFLHQPDQHVHQTASGSRNGGKRRAMAGEMGREIARSFQTYKTINFFGKGNLGHACAAWSGHDAMFFDPNWGEFWFERAEDFVGWFPEFWHVSGYGNPLVGLSEEWDVAQFTLGGQSAMRGLA